MDKLLTKVLIIDGDEQNPDVRRIVELLAHDTGVHVIHGREHELPELKLPEPAVLAELYKLVPRKRRSGKRRRWQRRPGRFS